MAGCGWRIPHPTRVVYERTPESTILLRNGTTGSSTRTVQFVQVVRTPPSAPAAAVKLNENPEARTRAHARLSPQQATSGNRGSPQARAKSQIKKIIRDWQAHQIHISINDERQYTYAF